MDDLPQQVGKAVQHFWATRQRQAASQGAKTGERDAGARSAVTGGRQLDGFINLCRELLVEAGLPLTAKIDTKTVAGQTVFSIAHGILLICLADGTTQECLRGMIALAPQRVVCLDPAFKRNDQLKTNTVVEMQTPGITFRTV